MSGAVVLIAGAGPRTRKETVSFHTHAVQATGKTSPRIAYVGAASNDSLVFEKLVSRMVFGRGATVAPVRLKKKSLKTSAARTLLSDADLVFFTGGDVELGMKLLEDRDLASYVRTLHEGGKVMEGISAGAIMLGQHWVRFAGDDETSAEAFPCLGLVPGSFDTHGEEDDWSELHSLARVVPGEKTVFGIPSGGAALWDGRALTALGVPLVRVRCGPKPTTLEALATSSSCPL